MPLIETAPVDGIAILKSPNGELKAWIKGEKIEAANATITEVFTDKIYLDEIAKSKSGRLVKRRVTLQLAKNGQSQIERIYLTDEAGLRPANPLPN